MKRVKAACIFQTLVFSQKEDLDVSLDLIRALNRKELDRYKASMDRIGTRYQIAEEADLPDGSILVRVRKQYNDKADVSEYFQ